jgi:hypothetical protein
VIITLTSSRATICACVTYRYRYEPNRYLTTGVFSVTIMYIITLLMPILYELFEINYLKLKLQITAFLYTRTWVLQFFEYERLLL